MSHKPDLPLTPEFIALCESGAIVQQLRPIADRLFDPILRSAPATSAEAEFMREAAEEMHAAWQGEDCDPAEAEFYLAVADYLCSEDTHQYGPTEHAINIARAYLGRDL